jgi:hypothetical protein
VGDRSRRCFATPADFPLLGCSLSGAVAYTHVYTYAAKVWEMCLVQGPFSVARCQTLPLRFATLASLYAVRW